MADKDRQERNADPAEPPGQAARKERFIARWSRRKGSGRTQTAKEPSATGTTDETLHRPSSAPTVVVEKTDKDMPPIESLDAESDYSQFLSPKVSERLRRAALRRLFHQPQYNVMDGLDTYIADCRDFTPLGDTITADMRHQMERHAKAALAGLAQGADSASPAANQAGPTAVLPDPPAKPAPPEAGADSDVSASFAKAGSELKTGGE